jgi:hypothetical protein
MPEYLLQSWNQKFGNAIGEVYKANKYILDNSGSTINFCNAQFVSPITLLGLCIINEAYRERQQDFAITLSDSGCSSFAKHLFFPEGFSLAEVRKENLGALLQPYHSKTYHPIFQLKLTVGEGKEASSELLNTQHGKIIKSQLRSVGMPIDIYESLSYMLGELTANLEEHSRAKYGYIVLQLYPKLGYMDVALGDAGKGFLFGYQNSPQHAYPAVTNDLQAMQAALAQKSTKDNAISRGYGLITSRKMLCEGLKGVFFMCSGNAFYLKEPGNEKVGELSVSFPGSFTALRIPLTVPFSFKMEDYFGA